jgi:hypothetical protein
MKPRPPLPRLPFERAQRLLATPDYRTDTDIVNEVGRAINMRLRRFPMRPTASLISRRLSLDDATLAAQVTLSFLEPETEVFEVTYPARAVLSDMGDCLRIGPGKVIRVGKAVSVAVQILGVFLAYAGRTPLFTLLGVWSGLTVVDLARNFRKIYEELSDDDERLVFETVFRLQNELSVVNYAALQSRNFQAAFAKIAPTTERVCAELQRKLLAPEVKRVLHHLESRGILTHRSGKWSISFW